MMAEFFCWLVRRLSKHPNTRSSGRRPVRIKGRGLGLRMLAGTFVLGAGLAMGRLMPSAAALGILGLAVGGAYSMVEVAYVTLRLSASPDALLARVATVAKTATVGAQPLGMLIGGLLIDRVGGGTTLAAMGVGAMVVAGFFAGGGYLRSGNSGEGPQP